jgi:peptide/nickel transport system substrate-binding protein
MIVRRFAAATAAMVLLIPATTALAGKKDNSIRFAYEQVIENVDPYFNSARGGVILGYQVWDGLIYRDPKTNEYRGLLATSWKWIDDQTLELELRRGVKFHNGATFDADDVVYTINYVSRPDNKVSNQQIVNWIASVEKLDQYKVRLRTREPFPAALEYLASARMAIHPHEYYAKVGPQGMNEKPIGSGPYRVSEHALGKYVRLVRNPDYFKDSPRPAATIEKVEIRFIPDRQTQTAEVLSGGIDMIINVPPDQAEQMRNIPNLQVVHGDTMRIMFLQLDTSERTAAPQLRDIRVRKAILHAIDRNAMVKSIVGEGASTLHSVCYPSQFGCTSEGVPRYNYDPAKAKQLLAEAGLPNGFDIEIYAYRERQHVEAMIGYLRAVGIRATLRFVQYAAMRDAVRAGKVPLGFQSWGSTSINDVSASTSVFYKGNPDDVNHDAEVRGLLERGDTSVDPNVRKEAYAKALTLIQERAYALPLYSLPMYYVADKDLAFVAHPDEVPRFWEMRYK